MFRRWNNLD
ncbi:hypothetical protein LINGRAHAP2_LOCUS10094 [Linum grandiflorum]